MMNEPIEETSNRIDLQNKEFDAVAELAEQYRRITLTPVVDDDYPEVRYDYERAVRALMTAFKANKREVEEGVKLAMEVVESDITEETESASTQQWAQAELPKGAVIHVNGIPFRIDAPVVVSGHPANLPLAGLRS